MLLVIGAVVAAGLSTVVAGPAHAATAPAFAATASLTPTPRYVGDYAGSVYEVTVRNTGSTHTIGAVEIRRPLGWTVRGCPAPPSGWSRVATPERCRFRTAVGRADDIKPGQSRTFLLKARTAPGTTDRRGTWTVVVSRTSGFGWPSMLKQATAGRPGLTQTLRTFEVTSAVVRDAAATPGSACPAANKTAAPGSTKTIVVCGRNHAKVNLTPVSSRSSLGGSYISSVGTFASGTIVHDSGIVVLGQWNGTGIVGIAGSAYVVRARIGAASNRVSSLATFTGYSATRPTPVAEDDAYSTDEDTPAVVNAANGVLANDHGFGSDPLHVAGNTQPSHGNATVAADGSFTYTPDANYNGSDSFGYTVNDTHSDSAQPGTVTITVGPVADAPTAADVSDTTDEDTPLLVTLVGADVDGDQLAFSIVAGPSGGSLGAVGVPSCSGGTCTATATYTPDLNSHGADSFTYEVNDGSDDSNTATVSLTIDPVNDAPVANPDSYQVEEDTDLSVDAPGVLANDTDIEGDPLTAVLVNDVSHGVLTLNSDGSFDYSPDDDYNGPDTFKYKANDGNDDSTDATVGVIINGINDEPVAVDDAQGVAENSTGATVPVLDNDTDADGDTLTVSGVDTTGTTGSVTNNGTDVTYDPNGMFEYLSVGESASDTFTYTVSDGHGGSDNATVTITIIGSNDIPVAVGDTYDTDEASAAVVNVVANDSDDEGAVTVTSVDTTGTVGTVTNNGDGTVTYDPNGQFEGLGAGQSDTDTFTYTVTDADGATDTATVTITVTGINDGPVAADDAADVGENSSGATVPVLGNDTDADGDTLTVMAVDTTGTTGTVTNNGTDVSYDPNGMFESLSTGQTATDTFTYTASDGNGGTDTATVTITVVGANDAPVAVADSYSIDEASAALVVVVANDSDAEGAVTVTSTDTTGTVGMVTNNNDGTVSYDPNGQFEGLGNGDSDTDSFTYTITDGNGATDTATVTITVNGINDAVVAVDDVHNVGENSAGETVPVLGNDTDAEGDTLTVTGVDTTGTSGMVTNNGTDVSYDPNGMFPWLDDTENATDTFTYTVTDGNGGSDTATVTITITGSNDPPSASDDAYQAIQDATLGITAPGVLTNDTDADGESLTAGNASDPANGSVTLDPNGAFSYFPDAGFIGPDTFTYDVSDGTATDTATVTITVVPPNATPTSDSTSSSGNEDGGAMTVTLTGHDTDGDSLTFDVGTATNGLVTVPSNVTCDGAVPSTCTAISTYTPNSDFNGSDSFTYTVNDGFVSSTAATASITVAPVNDEPSFTKGADQTVNEDAGAQAVSGWATDTSAGPANESDQTVAFTTATDNDALFSVLPTVAPNGELSYTPAADANGSATVTVWIADDGGTANGGDDAGPSRTFTITVTSVNDVPSFTKGADQLLSEDAGAQSVSNWATAISKGPADESGQTLSFTVTNDNNALFGVQPGVSPTGTLVYTGAPNAVGSATVSVAIADSGSTADGGDDTSDTQTFTITVAPVNDQPSFTDDGNQTVLEDAGAQTVNGFVNTTSAGPADESAQTVTVSVTGITNEALFAVAPAIDAAGTLTYTPAADAHGAATVTLRATDDGGTANGGDDTGPDSTFTVTVTGVNDAPSFTKGADQTFNEDAGAQSVSNWATAISKGPASESGQTLSFNVSNDNNELFSAQPTLGPAGTLTFTSAPNRFGTATVSVSVSDNGGTANGGDDTSGVQTFTITVNAVNDAPVAAAKAYTAQANMKLSLGGLLTGATDPNDVAGNPSWTPSYTLGSITVGAGCVGCTISNVNNANGTFDFDPPAGGTGTYTLSYTVVDNGSPGPGATSAAQTITFTVNGPVIWFVDANAGINGTGRLSAPFNNLASATTASGTNTNQRIFVQDGNVTGNVTLQTDGWLISDAATGTNFDAVTGVTPPAGTIARPTVSVGVQRTLTGTVTLGTNSVVRGFDLTPSASSKGLVASGKTGLVVNQMSITTTAARAVDLGASSGVFSLRSVRANGADRGISLVNTNVSTGSFAVTGTGSAGTGGLITASTASGSLAAPEGGIYLNNTKNVTLQWMTISGNAANGVYGADVTTLVLEDSTLPNNGTNEVLDHTGMHFANLLGTSSIARVDVSGSREDSAKVLNTSGTANLTVANSTFRDNNVSVGANGLYVDTKGSAAMTFTSTSNTFTNNNTSGLAVFGQSSQRLNATITGGTYTTNGVGLDLETNGVGGMLFTVTGGTVTGCAACGVPVNVYKGSGATGTGSNATAGTITGMVVTNGNSLLAAGIWAHGEGPGAVRLAITNNNISQVEHRGIDATFGNTMAGALTADVSITGNTINQSGPGTLNSIYADAGTLTGDSTTYCANIANNNITNAVATDIRVVNSYSTTSFRLPGYAGSATDTTAVQNFLVAQNTATDATATNAAGAPGFAGGGACAAP